MKTSCLESRHFTHIIINMSYYTLLLLLLLYIILPDPFPGIFQNLKKNFPPLGLLEESLIIIIFGQRKDKGCSTAERRKIRREI